ncbi:hypothetical protein E1262_05105 [Jiangella aurantiaca]|uniref:Uncharacterized protein n=1 Tax=Jiangella aurantiaca TaxID=2530373 RepID=A0A4R5AIK6_9ACTN|nr:hypothetical protein [Jiangella aurantiaca]TDD71535.1 hypothetical protein E1262_05105 [Jiangella aurantiaca]
MQRAFKPGECGRPVTMLGPAPDAPLELTVRLADSYARNHSGPLGTFTVTNISDRQVRGMSGPASWVWVSRDGVTVTGPGAMPAVNVPVELAPGESFTSDLHSVLRQCDATPADPAQVPGMPYPWDPPLAPGRYEVYVTWDLRGHDGVEIVLYAGPIGIDVR